MCSFRASRPSIRCTRAWSDPPTRCGSFRCARIWPMPPPSPTPANPQRAAIEQTPPGHVLVIAAGGELGSGCLGDILAARLLQRGVAGIVSDGAVRDCAELRDLPLPIFCAAFAAPPSFARMMAADTGRPIGCGGVPVFPGDIVVADRDGAVVIPRHLAAEVARDASRAGARRKVRPQAGRSRRVDRGLVSAQRRRDGRLSPVGRRGRRRRRLARSLESRAISYQTYCVGDPMMGDARALRVTTGVCAGGARSNLNAGPHE